VQDLIVRHNPARALSTLPQLLAKPADRARLQTLLERVMAEEGVQQLNIVLPQLEMLRRIRKLLSKRARPRAGSRINLKPRHSRAMQPA
jgi:hypothetical protein